MIPYGISRLSGIIFTLIPWRYHITYISTAHGTHHIKEIDESIRIISELSNGQLHVHNATPQPPNMVAESLRVFRQQFGRDPDHRNEMVEFRLG
jgi:hypothetical protein